MRINSDILIVFLALTMTSVLSAQISFEKHVIESKLDLVSSTSIVDIDGDGYQDIANTSWNTDELLWWSNSGSNPILWEKNAISDTLISASFIVRADIDNDNDIDLVVSGWGNNSINIFFNNGSIPINWEILTIEKSFNWAHEVRVADIDNDGYNDIIAVSTKFNTIAWWKNPGSIGSYEWTKYIVNDQCLAVRTVYPGDLDNDGRLDLVTASFDGNNISWYKNNSDLTWSKFEIEDFFIHPHMVHIVDLNSDGYLDVVCAGYSGFPSNSDVACWLNDGSHQDTWSQVSIDKQFNGALSITSADIDLDGDIDIVGTAELNTNKVAIWLNDNNASEWERIIVDELLNGAWGVSCGDIDLDGDVDISCGGDNNLVWYENTSQLALSIEDEEVLKEIYISSYPNPFNPIVNISYNIAIDSYVLVKIYDLQGNIICNLLNGNEIKKSGNHTFQWDGRDNNGREVSSGTYIVNINTEYFSNSKKICLLK